jgi:hypothetical protein
VLEETRLVCIHCLNDHPLQFVSDTAIDRCDLLSIRRFAESLDQSDPVKDKSQGCIDGQTRHAHGFLIVESEISLTVYYSLD